MKVFVRFMFLSTFNHSIWHNIFANDVNDKVYLFSPAEEFSVGISIYTSLYITAQHKSTVALLIQLEMI